MFPVLKYAVVPALSELVLSLGVLYEGTREATLHPLSNFFLSLPIVHSIVDVIFPIAQSVVADYASLPTDVSSLAQVVHDFYVALYSLCNSAALDTGGRAVVAGHHCLPSHTDATFSFCISNSFLANPCAFITCLLAIPTLAEIIIFIVLQLLTVSTSMLCALDNAAADILLKSTAVGTVIAAYFDEACGVAARRNMIVEQEREHRLIEERLWSAAEDMSQLTCSAAEALRTQKNKEKGLKKLLEDRKVLLERIVTSEVGSLVSTG
jgi:hypothetical protein